MKRYYILFRYRGKDICGCYKEGLDEEDAKSKAEWGLICQYPNVKWDESLVVYN